MSSSQQLFIFPARAVEPWEALEVNFFHTGTNSLVSNELILLKLDDAAKFPFVFPIPSKRAEGVTPHVVPIFNVRHPPSRTKHRRSKLQLRCGKTPLSVVEVW
ncbi:unnamed protein product [Ascophyllum nodosum]